MNYQIESNILKALAILALAAALLTVGLIAINSGVMGGGGSGDDSSASSGAGESATSSPEGEPASAEATATTATRTHVVQDGDSFYSIARKYNTTINEIQKLNPNIDPQNLTAGIRLAIP